MIEQRETREKHARPGRNRGKARIDTGKNREEMDNIEAKKHKP